MDLIKGGFLRPDQRLTFSRNGSDHVAEVTDVGTLVLEGRGEEYQSPSKTARVAMGSKAADGWTLWQLEGLTTTLHDLRKQLLDEADSKTRPSGEREDRHQHLRAAREAADSDSPQTLTVREFISWWGAKGRGPRIREAILDDLDQYEIETQPDFQKLGLDDHITIRRATLGAKQASTGIIAARPAGLEPSSENLEELDGNGLYRPYEGKTLRQVTTSNGRPRRSIKGTRQTTVREALTMLDIEGVQYVTFGGNRRPLAGVVTWRNIAWALARDPRALDRPISELPQVDGVPLVYDGKETVMNVLTEIIRTGCVFALDIENPNSLDDAITSQDLSELYRIDAGAFVMLSEIDQRLRQIVSTIFDEEELDELCGHRPYGTAAREALSFDDLTFGDYVALLENAECWDRIPSILDGTIFARHLDSIREVRNSVMHSNLDESEDNTEKISAFLRVVQRIEHEIHLALT